MTAPAQRTGVLLGFADLPDEAMMTEPALAEALNCSDRTVRRMIARGELPQPVLVGHRRLWKARSLRAWMDRRAADAQRRYDRQEAERQSIETNMAAL